MVVPVSSHPPQPDGSAWRERERLHAGGRPGSWGSLGLWRHAPDRAGPAADLDYATACAALAACVADAAGVQPGARVLCLACGAGDELQWLLAQRQAAQVAGVERDAALVAAARQRMDAFGDRAQVICGDAAEPPFQPASFDAVLCIDAAYHLRPRERFLQQAWQLLRPGGALAYTDLSLSPSRAAWRSAVLRGAAALCGVPAQDLLPAADQHQRLQRLGFEDVVVQDLTNPVLGGFAAFVRRQVRQPGWATGAPRARWTARLIAPCRAAGLGYVLLAGRKPSSAAATA